MSKNHYNKTYTYSGYVFNIQVQLNERAEKRPNGKIEHQIIVNDMGHSNFYKKFLTENIEEGVEKGYQICREYADTKNPANKSVEQLWLEENGFK